MKQTRICVTYKKHMCLITREIAFTQTKTFKTFTLIHITF